jgi:hypothetical protein
MYVGMTGYSPMLDGFACNWRAACVHAERYSVAGDGNITNTHRESHTEAVIHRESCREIETRGGSRRHGTMAPVQEAKQRPSRAVRFPAIPGTSTTPTDFRNEMGQTFIRTAQDCAGCVVPEFQLFSGTQGNPWPCIRAGPWVSLEKW